jgi:hypothetical protein
MSGPLLFCRPPNLFLRLFVADKSEAASGFESRSRSRRVVQTRDMAAMNRVTYRARRTFSGVRRRTGIQSRGATFAVVDVQETRARNRRNPRRIVDRISLNLLLFSSTCRRASGIFRRRCDAASQSSSHDGRDEDHDKKNDVPISKNEITKRDVKIADESFRRVLSPSMR